VAVAALGGLGWFARRRRSMRDGIRFPSSTGC